ncbi:MAG: phage terminase large subunit, partial [Paracoccaceae bacterium]|nr:phage terminase large subunit [Paracoccaceae bacterium]
FVKKVFQTLHPGREFEDNWHIDAIVHHLGRVANGEIRRAMIHVPPRALKSIIVSVAWPAYLLGHDPTLQIMVVSHSFELAIDLQNKFRKIIEADWYQSAFPTMVGATDKDNERLFRTTSGGMRLATSVDGSITGQGVDIAILDDPLDASEADNENACARANSFCDKVLSTRFNSQVASSMVLVMQRLSVFDSAAHMAQTDHWDKLVLPARSEEDRNIPVGPGQFHLFRKGELLHPKRLTEDVLLRQRSIMGEAAFLAQYQQRPIPGGGGVVDIALFQRYSTLPKAFDAKFISIDAASGSDSGSYSVLQSYQISDGQLFLTGSQRGRWPFPKLRQRAIELQIKEQADFIVVEYASSGIALLEELWAHYPVGIRSKLVQSRNPKPGKEIRMDRALVQISAGNVLFPECADWLPDLLTELQAFPNGVNDDQVDALSQAVRFFGDFQTSSHNPRYPGGGRVISG